MYSACTGCKKKGDNDLPVFRCDGCVSSWCKVCAELTASEVKVLQFKQVRTMKFFCINCLHYDTARLLEGIIRDKNDIIASKDRIIELLEKEILEKNKQIEICNRVSAENELNSGKTYAMAAAKEAKKSCENLPCIIVKPNTQQSGSKTRKEIESRIKPSKISVGISMIKELKNGSVILKCDSSRSTKKMRDEAQTVLGRDYMVSETKLLNPSVVIPNISIDMKETEVVGAISGQNDFLSEGDEFKVKVLKKSRRGDALYTVLQCNGSCYQKLITAGKINIGYNKCPVYENLNLLRCYKCLQFNHMAKDCRRTEPVCSKCAGAHSSRVCSETNNKCTNCVFFNSRFSCNFDADHSALDKNCSVYKQKLEVFRRKIDYLAPGVD